MTINLNEIIKAAAKFGVLTLGFYLLTPATTRGHSLSVYPSAVLLYSLFSLFDWQPQTRGDTKHYMTSVPYDYSL